MKSSKGNINSNQILGAVTILVGLYALILGIAGLGFSGLNVKYETYGGDAYTGMQNASASVANNLRQLGDLCSVAFGNAFAISGLVLIVNGADRIMRHSENGKKAEKIRQTSKQS